MKAFLCHSSLDKPYVDAVANRLGRARVEYDLMSFEPMVDFREAIRDALARSEFLTLFASRASLASYWVKYEIQSADDLIKQGRLRQSVALIIDDSTSLVDLPFWMRQARVERVRQPTRAARMISQHLHRLRGLEDQPLFIGRERLMAEFSRLLIGRPDTLPPRTILVHGLPGTGRRAFLQHAFKNFLSLELGPVLQMEPTDDLDALYLRLIGDLGELDTKDQLSAAIARFRAASPAAKAEELARLIAGLAEPNFAPVIVDNGGFLQANGQYLPSVLEFLTAVMSYKDVHVALVHARKPMIDRERLASVYGLQFRVSPIDLQATSLLLNQSLRRSGLTGSSTEVNELAPYMDGYPPAVYLAVSLIREYGLATLLADKSMLVDFKIRTFSPLLQKLGLEEPDWNCLRVLASEPILPFEALAAALGLTDVDMAMQLRRLIDLSLVTAQQNVFQISPPIREAVFVARGRLSDHEFGRIAVALEDKFWSGANEVPPMAVLAATVHAISRSNVAHLGDFGHFLLPSMLYRAAKEKYDEGGPDSWVAARDLVERVLDLDRKHRRARILRFRILVRLGEWDNAQRALKEIAATGDLEQHYLRGFLLWKRGRFGDAIDAFSSALRVGHTSVAVYHGLATCQLRSGWVEQALDTIREGLKHRRPNKFLLDLGVQVAVEAELYTEAKKYLEDLKRFEEDADYHHRAATLLSAQGLYEDALVHAERAVQKGRMRFEVLANRADILIELEKFNEAASEIDALDERFRVEAGRHDVRIGLRCKLLIRERKWHLAEQVLDQIKDRVTPQYCALRLDILAQKVKDPAVSPGERERALQMKEALERQPLGKTIVSVDADAPEVEETPDDASDSPSTEVK